MDTFSRGIFSFYYDKPRNLLFAGLDKNIKVFKPKDNKLDKFLNLKAHKGIVTDINKLNDEILLSSSGDGTIKVL